MKLMFKFFPLIVFILLAAICGYAQNDNSSSKPAPFEDNTQKWEEFSSKEGRFSASFPKPPQQSNQIIDLAPDIQIKLFINNLTSSAEYSVMYADYPIPGDNPDVAKTILDAGAKGAVASLKSELLEIKEIEIDGNPGRYLKERLKSGQIMRVKMFLVSQRLYQIAITTPNETGAADDEIKLYATISEKFLNSFKLIKNDEKAPTGQPAKK